jgi:predicted site-specific integrase-resolvase
MNTNQLPPLIRLADAARIYGLSKTTFIRLRKAKVLRVFKTQGGQNMFYRDDINNFLKSRTEENVIPNTK